MERGGGGVGGKLKPCDTQGGFIFFWFAPEVFTTCIVQRLMVQILLGAGKKMVG